MFSAPRPRALFLRKSGVENSALAARLALCVERGAQKIHGATPGYSTDTGTREHALGGALVGRHFQEVLAPVQDLAAGDFITGLAGDDVRSVDLPEPFGPP